MQCGQSHTNVVHSCLVHVTLLEKQARKIIETREAIGQGNEEKQKTKQNNSKSQNLPLEKTVGSPGM